jgi:acyl-[acyl-carrier-protein]-phospholipid O-acyltransferase/long-chain-fatty-acid--[acyl-carrier-protein] ligase
MTGAEKLKDSLADLFEDKFGIRPFEGYGATELSPAVSFNIDDIDTGKHYQIGNKSGTVGHPIPGVCPKIISSEDSKELGYVHSGELFIKGPNVMLGYLGDKTKTSQVIKDGWYRTGDIASIDGDGFITIIGRLSRFSKIAGEMVPHIALEEYLQNALQLHEPVLAVTSVSDDKKGEQLVVLHTAKAGPGNKLYEIVCGSELANIFKPKRENFILIDAIPSLASGKLDLMKIRKIAEEILSGGKAT